MKLIKPSYSILEQNSGLEGIYEQIELAGRTCYKSTPKIEEFANLDITSLPEGMSINELPVFKEHPEEFKQRAKELNLKVDYFKVNTSAKGFVDRMIASQHYAMLEHGTVYLKFDFRAGGIATGAKDGTKYIGNPYSKVNFGDGITQYVTTNYRVLVENGWLYDLKYLCEPTEFHEKRVTVRFTTSNGIMREFTRHRSHSFAVESTRYCNYSRNKFNNELTFIIPSWLSIPEGSYSHIGYHNDIDRSSIIYNNEIIYWDTDSFLNKDKNSYNFIYPLYVAETNYMRMIEDGLKPQEAREVLPLATKCDMVMTGFVSDWEHLFRLRTSFIAETGKPHPDMANLCDPLYKEFISKGYINNK